MRTQASLAVLAGLAACTMSTAAASTQTAKDIRGASPLVAIENKPLPRLIVDLPPPEPLAAGRVFIQYRTENLRVLPVFRKGDQSQRRGWFLFEATRG